jgi:peroxiredoxin
MTTLQKKRRRKFFSIDQDGKNPFLADYKGKKLVVFFYPKAHQVVH